MTPTGDTAGNWVGWRVELQIRQGRLEPLRDLTRDMVDTARTEPSTLDYARFLDPEGRTLELWERYVDAPAACEHLDRFAERYAERFLALVIRKRCVVYGTADEALRRRLLPLTPTYLPTAMGFFADADG